MEAASSEKGYLNLINEIISEAGDGDVKELAFGDLLKDSEMDSLGYAVFWTDLEIRLGIDLGKIEKIDYSTFKVDDLVRIILDNI